MLGRERDGRVHRFEPFADRLLGQPHHQVDADVVEAGAARLGDGDARAIGVVQPRQPAKLLVTERLDTETQSVDAGSAVGGEPRFADRLGVRLEALMMRPISSGSSSDGVPPPK
jgi:hypothetical protein